MSQFKVGDVLAGKYEIKAVLGAGGMGTVYRARQIDLGRDVAIKVPIATALEIPGFRTRFGREAKLCARLVHDNIVQVYEYVETDDEAYIVLEFVEGQDLKALVTKPKGDVTVRDIATILRASCEGLACAHEFGIVHRDIKPHNIMVQRRERGRWRVKIMDFGIAHMDQDQAGHTMGDEQLTATGQAIGTPSYMSPEQIRGAGVVPASDVYSFGCVIFYCFTRNTPFAGTGFTVAAAHLSEPPPLMRAKASNVPAELDEIVQACLAKDASKRPQNAADVGEEIFDALKPLFDMPMSEIWPSPTIQPGVTDIIQPTPKIASTQSRSADTMIEGHRGEATVTDEPAGRAADPTISEAPPSREKAPKPKPEPARDKTMTAGGRTNTAPSQLPDDTIPYDGPGAVGAPAPAKVSTGRAAMIGGGVLVVMIVIGVAVGLKLSAKKHVDDSPQPTPVATPVPRPTDEVVLVQPSPIAATPAIDVRPTPERPVATKAPAHSPTPSLVPTPSPDPVAVAIAGFQSQFERADRLDARSAVWANLVRSPLFAESAQMKKLAQTFAMQTAENPEMATIPAGTFTMGAPQGEGAASETPHSVSLSAYDIGIYEVTALEFSAFLNSPAGASIGYSKDDPKLNVQFNAANAQWQPREDRQLHPANGVTFDAANDYAQWLSKETGKHYDLPTEAQWECAARGGGTPRRYPWGDNSPSTQTARFNADRAGTVRVIELPDGRTLFNVQHMAGNVAEWCRDWYADDAYSTSGRDNPVVASAPAGERRSRRVLRGGSFVSGESQLPVYARGREEPTASVPDIGFRLVRLP